MEHSGNTNLVEVLKRIAANQDKIIQKANQLLAQPNNERTPQREQKVPLDVKVKQKNLFSDKCCTLQSTYTLYRNIL